MWLGCCFGRKPLSETSGGVHSAFTARLGCFLAGPSADVSSSAFFRFVPEVDSVGRAACSISRFTDPKLLSEPASAVAASDLLFSSTPLVGSLCLASLIRINGPPCLAFVWSWHDPVNQSPR